MKNGHIISYGDSHMVVGLILDKNFNTESEAGGIIMNSNSGVKISNS